VQSINVAPFSLLVGDVISIKIDSGEQQNITILSGDLAINGSATAEEVVAILSKINGVTPAIIEDATTGDQSINIRTNTPGPRGGIEILSSSMVGSSKLNFPIGLFKLSQQPQRVEIYEVRPNELIIELPAVVPALRRTLRGSHHFHQDSTLEPAIAPANEIWKGSFLYNPSGSEGNFTVSSQNAILQTNIVAGNILTQITVDDTSKFELPFGNLVIGWGRNSEEVNVRYINIPNNRTILIDPSYVFQKNHSAGEYINYISRDSNYIPDISGKDLPIYLTSPSDAREVIQTLLKTLAAAGVIINFVILAPQYKYLIDNPYIVGDSLGESN